MPCDGDINYFTSATHIYQFPIKCFQVITKNISSQRFWGTLRRSEKPTSDIQQIERRGEGWCRWPEAVTTGFWLRFNSTSVCESQTANSCRSLLRRLTFISWNSGPLLRLWLFSLPLPNVPLLSPPLAAVGHSQTHTLLPPPLILQVAGKQPVLTGLASEQKKTGMWYAALLCADCIKALLTSTVNYHSGERGSRASVSVHKSTSFFSLSSKEPEDEVNGFRGEVA